MSIIAIIIAREFGHRMGQDIPMQFINVYDKPVLIYTLEGFQKHPQIDAIKDVYGSVSVLLKTGGKKMLAGIFMFCIVLYLNRLQMNAMLVLTIQVTVGYCAYAAILLVLWDEWTQGLIEKVWMQVINDSANIEIVMWI